VIHLELESLQFLGHWLAKKWFICQTRKSEALKRLAEIDIAEDVLRTEWAAQVKQQTQVPLREIPNTF